MKVVLSSLSLGLTVLASVLLGHYNSGTLFNYLNPPELRCLKISSQKKLVNRNAWTWVYCFNSSNTQYSSHACGHSQRQGLWLWLVSYLCFLITEQKLWKIITVTTTSIPFLFHKIFLLSLFFFLYICLSVCLPTSLPIYLWSEHTFSPQVLRGTN